MAETLYVPSDTHFFLIPSISKFGTESYLLQQKGGGVGWYCGITGIDRIFCLLLGLLFTYFESSQNQGIIHLVLTQNFLKNWHFLPPDTHMYVAEVELRHYAHVESEACTSTNSYFFNTTCNLQIKFHQRKPVTHMFLTSWYDVQIKITRA